MREKDLRKIRALFSRRRAIQGMGSLLGASALGCGDDSGGGSSGTDGDTDAGTGSTSGTTGAGTDSAGSTSDPTGGSGTSDGSTGGTTGDGSGSTGGAGSDCDDDGGLTPTELLAEIDVVVVVMMENRSFDHYFGSRKFIEDEVLDGLDGTESNPDSANVDVPVFKMDNFTPDDPPHEWDECHAQFNGGLNDQFVVEHEKVHPTVKEEVMGYHVRDQLPVLYALADSYSLCDAWFSSVMGPTWPNRFYLHCATSGGEKGNLPKASLPTIWETLSDAGIEGRNYYTDVPWYWGAFVAPLTTYTDSIDEFYDAADAGTLPPFCIVDPGFSSNDDHPDHDITLGQVFLGTVYDALAASPQWDRCLLVITYDEHGGFYDHVAPPTTVDEDPEFEQLGFRVPAVVVGPHVRKGCVNSTRFEHVSVISTLTTRFELPPMNGRVSATNDLSSCIDPDYIGNPQPPAPLPLIDVPVDRVMARVGKSTSQKELWDAIDSGRVRPPPGADRRAQVEQTMHAMLKRAERRGLVRLR